MLVAIFAACKQTPQPSQATAVTLDTLQLGDQVKDSGAQLMALPMGMNRLDSAKAAQTRALVAVHGFNSAGYEWVYPLKTLGAAGDTQVYFYHWNDKQCPAPAAEELYKALVKLRQTTPTIESIHVVAHSYGGVISALMSKMYATQSSTEASAEATPEASVEASAEASAETPKATMTIDIVASPLAGLHAMESTCGDFGVKQLPTGSGMTLRQWRTQHELDGAFRNVDPDPQIIEDFPGDVVQLPDSYDGNRLGHNRSISWVADQLLDKTTADQQ